MECEPLTVVVLTQSDVVTLLELTALKSSVLGDKPLKFQVVCPQIGADCGSKGVNTNDIFPADQHQYAWQSSLIKETH